MQAPFTEDLQSLDGFLDQTQVGMAGPNTAIGDAIGLAVRTFEASDVDERLIILLSDGADTSSRMTPINAAAIAADRGVTIQTIGVGDPDASRRRQGRSRCPQGYRERTGGAFFFADDAEALSQIYDADRRDGTAHQWNRPASDRNRGPVMALAAAALC